MGGESKDRPESQYSKSTKKSNENDQSHKIFDMDSILPHVRLLNAVTADENTNMCVHHVDLAF